MTCMNTESAIDAGGESSESFVRVSSWKSSSSIAVQVTPDNSESVKNVKVMKVVSHILLLFLPAAC